MRAYYYTPEQCGMDAFPSGTLRLAGVEETDDHLAPDTVFVVPPMLHHLVGYGNRATRADRLYGLDHILRHPARHVAFNVGDSYRFFPNLPCLWLRCDCTAEVMTQDPTTVPIAWPVRDHADCLALPDGGYAFDVSFIGWDSGPLTARAVASCRATSGLACDIETHQWFYGYVERDDPERAAIANARYKASLRASRLTLCPASIPDGVIRYRLYEGLSAGRIPVLIGDGSVLPFGPTLDEWKECVVWIRESAVDNTGAILRAWLDAHDDAELARRGAIARRLWTRWMDSARWPELFSEIVAARMRFD